jgi:hypothetical protein
MPKTHCCFLSPVINTEKNSCLLLLCTCLVLILLYCTAATTTTTTNEVTHLALNGTMCGEEDTVKTNGTILIDAEWITSKNRSKTKIKVNRLEHEKYKFKPIVIGESKGMYIFENIVRWIDLSLLI